MQKACVKIFVEDMVADGMGVEDIGTEGRV